MSMSPRNNQSGNNTLSPRRDTLKSVSRTMAPSQQSPNMSPKESAASKNMALDMALDNLDLLGGGASIPPA